MRPSRAASARIGVVITVFAVAACTEGSQAPTGPVPGHPPEEQGSVVVSRPIGFDVAPLPLEWSGGSGYTVLFSSASDVDGASYVSFPSGSLPGADSVEVRNRTRDIAVGARVADGGVDPIAIPALVGDSLEIAIFQQHQLLAMKTRIVPPRTPPKIVRTDPPPGRTRVPLNAQIIVVFSEPMDPATIGPEVIQLLRSGAQVPGTVALEPNGWEARFTPAGRLDSLADYQLVVSTDAAGLGGGRLEEPATVPFSTGTELLVVTTIARTVFPTLYRGQSEILGMAYPRDDAGHLVAEAPVHWSSMDTSVVHVDSTRLGPSQMTSAWLTARKDGTARLIVTAGPVSDTIKVSVAAFFPAFTSIEAGTAVSCALDAGGQRYCWGSFMSNSAYFRNSTIPELVESEYRLRSLAQGNQHGCGILSSDNDNAGCWGVFGIGSGTILIFGGLVPLQYFSGGARAYSSISSGGRSGTGYGQTCAIEQGGAAYCWGNNQEGQLGDGQTYWTSPLLDWSLNRVDIQPVAVSGGHLFQSLSTGGDHSCGVTTDGEAYCWGNNESGQLGTGGAAGSSLPALVAGGLAFQSIDAGQDHTCALALDGGASCWGSNEAGQLGAPGQGSDVPVSVQGGHSFAIISSGGHHTCALTLSGAAYCWGENSSGQLGDGTTLSRSTPVLVQGGLNFVSISAGGWHTCGRSTGGRVYCWGDNTEGQLGVNTTTNRTSPALVVGQP